MYDYGYFNRVINCSDLSTCSCTVLVSIILVVFVPVENYGYFLLGVLKINPYFLHSVFEN